MYWITKEKKGKIEEIEALIVKSLKKEGFGIITRIELYKKIREKLGKEIPKHIILETCNPKKAYEAVNAEKKVSLLLPCNIIIHEGDGATPGSEDGIIRVSAIKPTEAMSIADNKRLQEIALEIERRLISTLKHFE